MKEYMITSEIFDDMNELVTVHKNIGGGAYIAVFSGTHNAVAQWLNINGISEYGIGY